MQRSFHRAQNKNPAPTFSMLSHTHAAQCLGILDNQCFQIQQRNVFCVMSFFPRTASLNSNPKNKLCNCFLSSNPRFPPMSSRAHCPSSSTMLLLPPPSLLPGCKILSSVWLCKLELETFLNICLQQIHNPQYIIWWDLQRHNICYLNPW